MKKKGKIAFYVFMLVFILMVFGCNQVNLEKEETQENGAMNKEEVDMSEQDDSQKVEQSKTYDFDPFGNSLKTYDVTEEDIAEMAKKVGVIETNKGIIKIKFYPQDAPQHVANFIDLAGKGFFDGLKFHRFEEGFVIQGGDPLSADNDPSNDGSGGPGYRIKAEYTQKHLEGSVGMARGREPESNGSQFYVCLSDLPALDGQYTVYGQVIEGMDTVYQIRKGDIINKITIEEM